MPWLSPSREPAVFYVTDRRAFGDDGAISRLLETIARVATAGVDAIQIREKDLPSHTLLELAAQAAARIPAATKLLVNDRLDVAIAAGAAGVHLGGESVPVADAVTLREKACAASSFLVGRSCHSLDEVLAAERDGADYVFFGPVFRTPAKERYGTPQGTEALAAVCSRAKIPVIAIGGITLENAAICAAAGAKGIAAIRLFQEALDPPSVVQRLKELAASG